MSGSANYQKNSTQSRYSTTSMGPSQVLSPLQNTLEYIIDSKLSWNIQNTYLCNKANNTLAFIQHNLYGSPQVVKEECFNVLVTPVLEYGCSFWDPHQARQIENLEKIRKRAARFVTGNYAHIPASTALNIGKLGAFLKFRQFRTSELQGCQSLF